MGAAAPGRPLLFPSPAAFFGLEAVSNRHTCALVKGWPGRHTAGHFRPHCNDSGRRRAKIEHRPRRRPDQGRGGRTITTHEPDGGYPSQGGRGGQEPAAGRCGDHRHTSGRIPGLVPEVVSGRGPTNPSTGARPPGWSGPPSPATSWPRSSRPSRRTSVAGWRTC
jgi:hypothetical protein